MQKSGGAAIPMKTNMHYRLGTEEIVKNMKALKALPPFDPMVIDFLNDLSKAILKRKEAKAYPDVITFGFYCRKANMLEQKKKLEEKDRYNQTLKIDFLRFGRGIAFHIAPSNVPVNFAYSMVAGLLAGNANIIRLSSKAFKQVEILIEMIKATLNGRELEKYLALVTYDHSEKINQELSSLSDTRIIWGGDKTIQTIRKASLNPRAFDITFSDRYSMAVIDIESYLKAKDKEKIAKDFYNDTYLTDQNACTSPKIIFWLGKENNEDHRIQAKREFWESLNQQVQKNYVIEGAQAVNKQSLLLALAAKFPNIKKEKTENNKLIRVNIPKEAMNKEIKHHFGNSGYFLETTINTLKEMNPLCESQCQTLSYYGIKKETLCNFIKEEKPKGIDRIVPIGKTMDFELIWDGIDLIERLTRIVNIS